MRRLLLLLIFLFLIRTPAAFSQTTNIGGFPVPPPWTNVPMSLSDILNGNMESCTGGPCAPGNLTLSNWTSTSCTIIADSTHVHSGTSSMLVTSCGSSAANGLIQQTITYQGLGGSLEMCIWAYTDASFSAPSGMDGPLKAFGVDLSDTAGRKSGQTNGGVPLTVPTNSQGWFHLCSETVINRFPYTNISLTFQIRFPIPGMTGKIWFDDATVTENDAPGRNFITSAVDGVKGYFWSDELPNPTSCATGGTIVMGEFCGELETNIPAGSASLTQLVQIGNAPGCPVVVATPVNNVLALRNGELPWSVNVLSLFSAEASPLTPRYICTKFTDNTTHIVYQYPDYTFYVLDSRFRSTLTNYIDFDSVIVSNGVRHILWGAYDSCTSNLCSGATNGGPFSLSSPGLSGNPVTSYLQYWEGEGFYAPQSLTSAALSGTQIKVHGPYRAVDWAANFLNTILNFVDATTLDPRAGTGDQLGPLLQLYHNYGIQHIQIMNFLQNMGWDGGATPTASTVPFAGESAPAPPSIISSGGFIKGPTLGATNYIWVMECPLFWGTLGQQGNTLQNGMCSLPVATTNQIGSSTTSSLSVPMAACPNARMQGWEIAVSVSSSNVTPPPGDTFFLVMDSATTANEGWIDCSSRGGPSTLTITGNQGDGNSLALETIMATANDPVSPAWVASNISTISISGGTATVTMSGACSFSLGNGLKIQGTSNGNLNVVFAIVSSACSGTSWQFKTSVTGSATGGTATLLCLSNCGIPSSSHGGATVAYEALATEPGGLTEPTYPGVFLYSNNGTLTANGTTTVTGNNSPNPFCTGSGAETALNGEAIVINSITYSIISLTCPNTMVVNTTVPTGTLLPWSIQPTVNLPPVSGAQTALYTCEAPASGTAQPNPWHFYLQQNPGSSLVGGANYVVPSQSLFTTNVECPADLTYVGRSGWNTGLTDAQINTAFAQLFTGADSANYPQAGSAVIGIYLCDECGPMHSWAGAFQQGKGVSGVLPQAPGLITFCVSTTPADYKFLRDSCDVPQQDPYCCGRLATSDLVMIGGSCRNDFLYQSTNNGASLVAITATVLTSNVATYSYTLISGANPAIGQKITIVNTTNGSGIFNVQNAVITATATGNFSIALVSSNVTSASDTGIGTAGGPSLTSGCANGGNQLLPQQTDNAAFGCMFGSYASRPCILVLQYFQAVSLEKGFTYGTLRRACWKGLIDVKSFGDNGGGCIWWAWGNGAGDDLFYYTNGNWGVKDGFRLLATETNDPQFTRTYMSPTLDGSGPTAVVGFNSPGIGKIITAVTLSITTQAGCSPTTLTPNTYINTNYYPFGQLSFFTARDPILGDILFGFNNLCGSVHTNGTGGSPNFAKITLNSSAIPPGATQVEVVGGDLNGNNTWVLGSNVLCPTFATVAANEFCFPMNDQEASFGWLRFPREKMYQGQATISGKVQ